MTNPIDPGAAVPPIGKAAKKEVVYDLMRGGAGTPWENRGEHGPVGGFVKSATRAVLSPGLLFDHIRTTTITADSQTFLWICAACWGIGVAATRLVGYFRMSGDAAAAVDGNTYLVVTLIHTAVAVGWAFLMFRLVILLYHKLATTEMKQPLPASLTFNIVAYAMGPSLFAVIPIVGAPIALVGSFVSLVAAGRKRLFMSWRGAIIDAVLVYAVVIVATGALYAVGSFLLNYVFGTDLPTAPDTSTRPPAY